MKTNIIKAQLSYAHDVAYVHVNSWRAAYKGIVPDEYLDGLSIEKSEEKFRKFYEKGISQYYLMYADEKPAGILVYSKSYDKDADDKTADLGVLYFLPEYWGRGLGAELLRHGIEEISMAGYERITLWVLEQNARARKFYDKNGFEFDGTRDEITIGKTLMKVRYKLDIK